MNELQALLPAAQRRADELLGGPLADLLRLLEGPLQHLDEDLAQLYDDLFIETCAEWVLPYLGDLVAHRPLRGLAARLSSPRADVARTIAYRRRKGTVAVLEQIARDISGFPARAVESWQRLAITQHHLHLRPHRTYAPDLRRTTELRRHGDPFDDLARTADVRRSQPYRLSHVRVFLWRLLALPLRRVAPLHIDTSATSARFLFSPVGGRVPLFHRPDPAYEGPVLADSHVPHAITRRELHDDPTTYYGERASLAVHLGDDLVATVRAADLSDRTASTWQHEPTSGEILIDPELGRLAVDPALLDPARPLTVSFHVGAPGELGGGQYDRARPDLATRVLAPDDTDGLRALLTDPAPLFADGRTTAVLELEGSLTHQLTDPILSVPAGKRLIVRAAARERPVLALDLLTLTGGQDGELELDGLAIAGPLVVAEKSALRTLTLRHCTLVPGLAREPDGSPRDRTAASLEVRANTLRLALDHCITGPLRLHPGVPTALATCILDASAATAPAYAGLPGSDLPGGPLSLDRCTVIGTVHAEAFELVTNSILVARLPAGSTLAGPVVSERRQVGCIRYSYLPPGSQTPRRFRCQPEAEERRVPDPNDPSKTVVRAPDPIAHAPLFGSLRFGSPHYAVLSPDTPPAIRAAADDEGEPGVFHDLFYPHIEANVRARLDEFLRFGLDAELTLVT